MEKSECIPKDEKPKTLEEYAIDEIYQLREELANTKKQLKVFEKETQKYKDLGNIMFKVGMKIVKKEAFNLAANDYIEKEYISIGDKITSNTFNCEFKFLKITEEEEKTLKSFIKQFDTGTNKEL